MRAEATPDPAGARLDPTAPDPFGVVGFVGVIPAEPARSLGRPQARYAFANGFGAGVLFGAQLSCESCQTPERPYELHALHGPERALCERTVGHACGLDAATVRQTLLDLAAQPAQPECDHGRA